VCGTRICEAVSKACDGDLQMIDPASIRVHQHAANARGAKVKKRGPRRQPPLGTQMTPDAWGAREAG